jgi:hypothetical protein
MNQRHHRTAAGLVLALAITALGACGTDQSPKQERPSPAPATEDATSSQPFRTECRTSPDTLERLARAGRSVPGCVVEPPTSFGDERRTSSR